MTLRLALHQARVMEMLRLHHAVLGLPLAAYLACKGTSSSLRARS